jgi:hypothetical protein
MEFLTPWLLVGGLFIPLRRLERWLHQHLFKVGWLATHRLRGTTALYYTFFLPGVLLHEVVRWLVAGFLNVQAERVIAWPAAQEIGELKLNFIQLTKDVSSVKKAIISTAPLVAGVIVVYFITNNILNMSQFVQALLSNSLDEVPNTLAEMAQTPDFLLWVYITFTIANTMMPNFSEFKRWWVAVFVGLLLVVGVVAAGAGDESLLQNIAQPISNGLSGLAGVFVAIIAIDLIMVAILGTIEAVVERATGHSVTFKNGKMITMTRQQARELKEQEQAKRAKELERRAQAVSGPPTIYKLPLPIPDPPEIGELAGPKITVRREEPATLSPGAVEPEPRPAPTLFTRGMSTPLVPNSAQDNDEDAEADEDEEEEAVPDLRSVLGVGTDDDADKSDEDDELEADEDNSITREPPEEPA